MANQQAAFPVGSLIRRPLGNLWGWFYSHTGVYVGQNQVIHFHGERKKERGACLRKDAFADFAGRFQVALHAAPRNEQHAAAVVSRAEEFLASATNTYNGRYSWLFNNCEDFCIACFEADYEHPVST